MNEWDFLRKGQMFSSDLSLYMLMTGLHSPCETSVVQSYFTSCPVQPFLVHPLPKKVTRVVGGGR